MARWMDDHAEAWHNANWDEDSWRCTISALGSDYLLSAGLVTLPAACSVRSTGGP